MVQSHPPDVNVLPVGYRPRRITAKNAATIGLVAVLVIGLMPAYAAKVKQRELTSDVEDRLSIAEGALAAIQGQQAGLLQTEQRICDVKSEIEQLTEEFGAIGQDRIPRADSVAAAVTYLLTNPYVILDPKPYLASILHHGASGGWGYAVPEFGLGLSCSFDLLVRSFALPLGLLGAVQAIRLLRSGSRFWRRMALGWVVAFLALAFFVSVSRILVFLGPPLCLLAGNGLDQLLRRRWLARLAPRQECSRAIHPETAARRPPPHRRPGGGFEARTPPAGCKIEQMSYAFVAFSCGSRILPVSGR